MENEEFKKLYLYAKSLSGVCKNREDVAAHLKLQTLNEVLVEEVLEKLRKEEVNAAKNESGVVKLLLGVALLGSSFIISYIHYHSDIPFELIMYGFTSTGLVLLVWGLYDLLH